MSIRKNLRAGIAYQLVLWASRIYPPLIGEMVSGALWTRDNRDRK